MEDPRTDVNIRDDDSKTALIAAAKEGHPEVVQLILNDQRIDVNIRGKTSDTALIAAARNGNIQVCKLLLKLLLKLLQRIDVHLRG